ncbi:RDD family protein [Helicobacter sp. 11S03491-1]|uniref:RDD family protein n=1 Tax=Helicobacter sp. 11S03491-1 TaxID=1476196 RepID=UPI000BA6DA83|nr:RDD family protein [Helicobacter sp. 11S03491-1]PAF41816.1 hypothetical protein BKH45_05765 [Helicobacter sp. 11S03491-1]
MIWTDDKIEEMLYREDLSIALFSHRVGAFLIDILVISFLVVGFCLNFLSLPSETVEAEIFFIQKIIFLIFIFSFVYEVLFMKLFGATFGKIIFRLKVVLIQTLDKPNFKVILQRCFIKVIEQMMCCVLFVFALDDKFLRTFHDRFNKTIVISMRQ